MSGHLELCAHFASSNLQKALSTLDVILIIIEECQTWG